MNKPLRRVLGIVAFCAWTVASPAATPKPSLDWWSLQPLRRAQPPAAISPDNAGNGIDAFLRARLTREHLSPAPEADRRTLIRRLTFDLLGLPPSPEEVESFVNDPNSNAYEMLVDRCLASPHYGERWARHWLDIAHYADTHGFERDQKRERAWPYRDWVIRAWNDDMPYDQFVRLQIAGDVMAPRDRNAVIATGFLAAGPWDKVGQDETPSPVLKRAARADDLNDMVTQVITSTMGLTVNCARCHNHKLDPITQRDYYQLWAVFAGLKRTQREVYPADAARNKQTRESLAKRRAQLLKQISALDGKALSLADLVGGGDGRGSDAAEQGIDPNTAALQTARHGFLNNVSPNVFHPFPTSDARWIDGVFIPEGSTAKTDGVIISSTGLKVHDLPPTSGQSWDAIRNGPVQSQFSTRIAEVDFHTAGHDLLAIHANAGITFDLAAMRQSQISIGRFSARVGYGGKDEKTRADFHIYLDGQTVFQRLKFGRNDGGQDIDLPLPTTVRFLTLVSTDGGDGIGHDQVFLGDPRLHGNAGGEVVSMEGRERKSALQKEADALQHQIETLPAGEKFYGVMPGEPPTIQILRRGSAEDPTEEVVPGALSCLRGMDSTFGDNTLPEGQRRLRLAEWIVHRDNPLTARVLVNRLWHHHFGKGIVDTPSDFGAGGGAPSHPELLDWLASEFIRGGWSVKRMQRLIVTSAAYRQAGEVATSADPSVLDPRRVDSGNRLLWHMSPRRLDSESLRDAVLRVTGCLNLAMGGPGYQDFTYQEAYAPIYQYITADRPELWRRTLYRFLVRTTPDHFMIALDCPDSANLTPARNVTTTALQSLALLNNEFMVQQSAWFAKRAIYESSKETTEQIRRAFLLAFQRPPTASELKGAQRIVQDEGLPQLCRLLMNANEFLFVE